MFIYNVSVKVDWRVHDEWLLWMKNIHIPEVVATGCFTHAQMLRLLETDEQDGPTYITQYFAKSKSDYNRYIDLHAASMRQKAFDKWGDTFIAFRSLMQLVQ